MAQQHRVHVLSTLDVDTHSYISEQVRKIRYYHNAAIGLATALRAVANAVCIVGLDLSGCVDEKAITDLVASRLTTTSNPKEQHNG